VTLSVARLAAAVLLALLAWSPPAAAFPPPDHAAALRRGINITGWFRYPASRDPAVLRAWLSDAAMADLKRAGFTFVRLAVDPALLDGANMRQVFLDQVRRLQRQGLAVVVSPHPTGWNADSNAVDRARLVRFWHELAPALSGLPPAMTFPEVLNEPVFHADPSAWWSLQNDLHAAIRAALPADTIILTGQDWGSIAGLLALPPPPDTNVIYSFHFYDPAELTSLAAYRPGMDREALARLPFPETAPRDCDLAAGSTRDTATRDLIAFYCATGWDAAHVRAQLQSAVSWAGHHGVALLAGEFGASAALNPAARLAWLRLVRETCEGNGIGWALWGYDDVMGFAIPRPPGNRPVLDRSVLESLGLSVP
jgi:endoglucanase